MAKTYKVKSDYTLLRKRSQVIPDGTVYENNIMTINPLDDLFADGITVSSHSNFRFSVNSGPNLHKKHSRDTWVGPDNGRSYWTKEDVQDAPISEESIVRVKPDYNSLRDFAYYGSSADLVKGTINDVIMNFPAELYFTGEEFTIETEDGYEQHNGGYIIMNDYSINLDMPYVNGDTVDNPIRFMCLNANNYDLIGPDGRVVSEGFLFSTEKKDFTCKDNENGADFAVATLNSGGRSIEIYVYQKDGVKSYYYKDKSLVGYSIRPCDIVVQKFYGTIDDFEYVLLSRDGSVPYKAVFETPYETDTGNKFSMESYIWPSINGWNPIVSGPEFNVYLEKLINLAMFSDMYDSNNIWRMMTHEAIKNLDWTYKKTDGVETEDFTGIDSTKIEKYIQICGRQFDGLKRYIDNIKNHNKVSYDEKNNVPDYELSDMLGISGWDVCTLNPTAQTTNTSDQLYHGRFHGFNEVEMNTSFMRTMKINSKYLTSLKGTRHGLDAILGILGVKDDEYEIKENVVVFKGTGDYCNIQNAFSEFVGTEAEYGDFSGGEITYPPYNAIAAVNVYKKTFGNNITNEDEYVDMLEGIPVRPINVFDDNGNIKYQYVVPWYDMDERYDGGWYFQSKGGWGMMETKRVTNPFLPEYDEQGNPVDREIVLVSNGGGECSCGNVKTTGFTIYKESNTYMKFVNTVDELLSMSITDVNDGDICYVTSLGDITRYGQKNGELDKDLKENGEYSHYFILKNKYFSTIFGTITVDGEERTGWVYVPLTDLKNVGSETADSTEDAVRVVYLETIEEKYEGNNPHTGYGHYDGGCEYIEYMRDIFKYSNENNGFEAFTDSDKESIKKYVFDDRCVEDLKITDNDKCWYFANIDEWKKTKLNSELADIEYFKNAVSPEKRYDFPYSEPAANSIINIKNMMIYFKYPKRGKDEESLEINRKWEKYIEGTAMNYITQMIPSTTLWGYKFLEDTATVVGNPIMEIVPARYNEIGNEGGEDKAVTTASVVISGKMKYDISGKIVNFRTTSGGTWNVTSDNADFKVNSSTSPSTSLQVSKNNGTTPKSANITFGYSIDKFERDGVTVVFPSTFKGSKSTVANQGGVKMEVTGLTFTITSAPKIPASGGTVTIDQCTKKVEAKFNDGHSEDVTNSSTYEGTTSVSAKGTDNGGVVGTIRCVAKYSGITSNEASIGIEKDTAEEKSRSVSSIIVNPIQYGAIGSSGGTISPSTNASINITWSVSYTDGTTRTEDQNNYSGTGITWQITSSSPEFDIVDGTSNSTKLKVSENTVISSRSSTITTKATYGGATDNKTSTATQSGIDGKTPRIISIEYEVDED